MDAQNVQTENQPEPAVSCRKHVKDDKATFFANLKGRFNVFVNSSMDEHKACFQNSMDKIFGRSKAVEEKKIEAKEVESHAPLQPADST